MSFGGSGFGGAGAQGMPGPPGIQGAPGAAATVAVGAVTTGAPGSSASVTNVGTLNAAILDFAIPRGDAGTNGTNGNTILFTVGAPGSGFGVDGDYAIDPTAGRLYGPKTAGVWGSGISLIGPGQTFLGQNTTTSLTTSAALESTVVTIDILVPASGIIEIMGFIACTLTVQGNLSLWLELVGVLRHIMVCHFHTTASATRGGTSWPAFRVSGLTPGATLTLRIRWNSPSGTRGVNSGNEEIAWVRANGLAA